MRADCILAYIEDSYRRDAEEFSFRAYVTECIRLQAEGKVLSASWSDAARPSRTDRVDVDKVVDDLVKGGGLVLK